MRACDNGARNADEGHLRVKRAVPCGRARGVCQGAHMSSVTDRAVECAPGSGQIGFGELTAQAGLSADGRHKI
jgi:hypothetical protein